MINKETINPLVKWLINDEKIYPTDVDGHITPLTVCGAFHLAFETDFDFDPTDVVTKAVESFIESND